MPHRPHIVHLIDDTTAGGVMRVLDHIATSPAMAASARHSLRQVPRGSVSVGRIDADAIVSHLTVTWRGLPGLTLLRALHRQIPLIHVEHSYTQAFTTLNVTARRRFHGLLRHAYGLFDRVVAVSEGQAGWLRATRLVRPERLTVIRSCVDLSAFRALPPVSGPVRVLGAIGRLDAQKGFDTLIRAFRDCDRPDLTLRIFGEGEQEPALRALAAGDPRIGFMGFAADPVAAMASVDAVAMPSRWEAYGLVALEALAARRHLLVNDLDGLHDHVDAGAVAVAPTLSEWQRALGRMSDLPFAAWDAPSGRPEDSFAERWQDLIAETVTLRRGHGRRLLRRPWGERRSPSCGPGCS